MEHKKCSTCGELKSINKFKLRNPKTGNRSPNCGPCVYAASRDHIRDYQNQYRASGRYRNADYQRRYGVTLDWYTKTLAKQNNGCAICGATDHRRSNVKHFAVDHDHETGVARGVVCHPCNLGLGYFQDDPELLRKAALYIERSKLNDESD